MSNGERQRIHSLAFELTNRCTLRCAPCYNASRPDGAASHAGSWGSLAALESLLHAIELGHLTRTGGEPLLSPTFTAAAATARSHGVPVCVVTTGTLLHEHMAARLAACGVRRLQVSLHGPDAWRHDAATGVRSFAAAMRAVRRPVSCGIAVTGCMVLTHRNAKVMGATLDVWGSVGVDRVALKRFSPAKDSSKHALQLLRTMPDLHVAFGQTATLAKRTGMRVTCALPVPPCAMDPSECAPIRFGSRPIGTSKQELVFGTDGRLRHCPLQRLRVSDDVREAPGEQVRLALRRARDYHSKVPAFCVGCLHAGTCGGGCGAAADRVLGDARAKPDPLRWQHVDDTLAARLAREAGRRGTGSVPAKEAAK